MTDSVEAVAAFSLGQADSQIDSELPSTPVANITSSSSAITSARKRPSFEATTAALDTNELLHLIMAEVPRELRVSLRGVSKSWNITGYTIEPSCYKSLYRCRANSTALPLVSSAENLEINLVFRPDILVDSRRYHHDNVRPGSDQIFRRLVPFADETADLEYEFITNPPLTQVLLCVGPNAYGTTAILRVPGGIRVGDLAEYRRRMLTENMVPDIWWFFGREGGGSLDVSACGQSNNTSTPSSQVRWEARWARWETRATPEEKVEARRSGVSRKWTLQSSERQERDNYRYFDMKNGRESSGR